MSDSGDRELDKQRELLAEREFYEDANPPDQQLAAKVDEILKLLGAVNIKDPGSGITYHDVDPIAVEHVRAALLQAFSEQERLARIDELQQLKRAGTSASDFSPGSNGQDTVIVEGYQLDSRIAELQAPSQPAQPTKEAV